MTHSRARLVATAAATVAVLAAVRLADAQVSFRTARSNTAGINNARLQVSGQCVDFSPYVAGYDPDLGRHPPPAVIDRLLDALVSQTGTTCITTYGVLNGLGYTFEAARRRGLKVTAIIWLDADASVNSASIAAGVQYARQYDDTITRVSCGSEVRTRHGLALAESVINACVNQLRAAGVTQPITSIDTWWEWCSESQPCQAWSLGSSLDWIGVNVFAWWENRFSGIYPCTTAAQAADFTLARLQEVAARYPNKSTVLSEFGWPAGPDGFREINQFTQQQCGVASEANQRLVLESTIARLNQLGLSGAAFEAFREGWKERHEGAIGSRWGFVRLPPVPGDYDGDGISDLVVYRPGSGMWFQLKSISGFTESTATTLVGVPVPGDYDGDGKTDLAVFGSLSLTGAGQVGLWSILQSSTATSASSLFGSPVDLPVPGDYDGDGKTDLALYNPSTGVWSVQESSAGTGSLGPKTFAPGLSTDIPVPADYDGDGKTDVAVYRPFTGTWYILQSSSGSATSVAFQWGLSGDIPVSGDYDGDGMADLAVYRPATGVWHIRQSSTSLATSVSFQWGLSTDTPVPGDYDGDGKIDLAVFRPATGTWYIRQSTTGYATSTIRQWGLSGDVPAPNASIARAMARTRPTLASLGRAGDFDGDGRSDITVMRPSNGTWFTLRSSTNYASSATVQWGLNGDIPVPGDYDGDGVTDFAVFRPVNGTWYLRPSNPAFPFSGMQQWGLSGDDPVPGDYDRDGKTDVAVYRPSSGTWYILPSNARPFTSLTFQWGLPTDVAVPGDYDGDGITDLAVWRPSTGTWFIRLSTTAYASSVAFQWGLAGDITVPGDYDGDGMTDLAIWRPSNGTWFIRQSSTSYTTAVAYQWGLNGDTPVPADFDGDGKTDVAVWRSSNGTWFILKSSASFTTSASYQWGLSGDIPILPRD